MEVSFGQVQGGGRAADITLGHPGHGRGEAWILRRHA